MSILRNVFIAATLVVSCFCRDVQHSDIYIDQNVSGWLASELYDGVRAYWDGKTMLNRNGEVIHMPSGFDNGFPPFALDGVLYTKRGDIDNIELTTLSKTPDEDRWQDIKYYIFDVPDAQGGVLNRLNTLTKYLVTKPNPKINVITQIKINSKQELFSIMELIVQNGGEGVIVRNPDAPYERKITGNLLRVKGYQDAYCNVTKLVFSRMSGIFDGIECKDTMSGKIFTISSGFSEKDRRYLPQVGDRVRYKFQNLTKNGFPRFPAFIRITRD